MNGSERQSKCGLQVEEVRTGRSCPSCDEQMVVESKNPLLSSLAVRFVLGEVAEYRHTNTALATNVG